MNANANEPRNTAERLSDADLWRYLNETAIGAQARAGYLSAKAVLELARAVERAYGIRAPEEGVAA